MYFEARMEFVIDCPFYILLHQLIDSAHYIGVEQV